MWYLPAIIAAVFLAFAFLAISACILGGRMEAHARRSGNATPAASPSSTIRT